MLVINGIFKDNTFVPDCEIHIPDGTRVTVSVKETVHPAGAALKTDTLIVQQKKAWHDFFEGIRLLDEELPAEFDTIINKGIAFNKVDFA